MTDEKILTKAISKAIAGGFKGNLEAIDDYLVIYRDVVVAWWYVIYQHDFAKALWPGTTMVNNYQHFEKADIEKWFYHLQQMVIAEDPIQYLKENI